MKRQSWLATGGLLAWIVIMTVCGLAYIFISDDPERIEDAKFAFGAAFAIFVVVYIVRFMHWIGIQRA